MDQKTQNLRRKSPLVDARSQLYISLLFLLYLTLYSIVLIIVLLLPSVLRFTIQTVPLHQQYEASREFLFMDRRVVPAVVIVALVMSVHVLFLTQRIFGPLKRLKDVLAAWEDGRWPSSLRTRRKDFHGELFVTLNHSSEAVGRDMRAVRDLISPCSGSLRGHPGGEDSPLPGPEEAEEECQQAVEILNRYFPKREERALQE